MKRLVTLLMLFVVVQSNATLRATVGDEVKPKHPSFVSFNDRYYDDKGFKSGYFGKVGALSGKVIKVEKGPENRLIFQLELEQVGNTLWVGLLPKTIKGRISPGANIAVMGYFDHSEKEPEFMAKLSDSAEYLLGYCLIEKVVGLPIFYTKWLGQCLEWESGQYDFESL